VEILEQLMLWLDMVGVRYRHYLYGRFVAGSHGQAYWRVEWNEGCGFLVERYSFDVTCHSLEEILAVLEEVL